MTDAIDIFTRQRISGARESSDEPVEIDEVAVGILEGLLERVKSGDLTAFALVGLAEGENNITAYTRTMFDDPYMFLGLLEDLKCELLMYLLSLREE